MDAAGAKLNVPADHRFTGLSAYKRLLEQKLDAVAIESPPFFHPMQAADAVAAGKHVYLAKPVAVDVPGCLSIEESGKKAAAGKLVFLVDFQTRAMANFKVLSKVDRDYMIFVHVEDVDGRVDRLNVDHAPRVKPTSQWVPGEIVQDVFDIPIPAGMPVRGLSLVLGFWDPRTDTRLPIVNKDQVPNDGRERLFVAKFPVAQPQ